MATLATATPLHTRMITLRLSWSDEGEVLADGRLLDVRKRGIVPLGGRIEGPGVVHDMAARVWIDVERLTINRIEPQMRAFPFAPSPQTRGEGCPDRIGDVQSLVGLSLQRSYGESVMGRIGGPRGCFHVLTLLRLLGPSVVWALTRERLRAQAGEERACVPGNPIFARSLLLDGLKPEGLELELHGALSDIHYPPGADRLPFQEELEMGFEAEMRLRMTLPAMEAHDINGRMRYTGPGVEAVGSWERIESLERLGGIALRKGFSARVQELFGDAAGVQPLTHLVLMLAPLVMQCMPSLLDELEMRPRRAEGPHAATDSCHMWRADGPLQ